jgi:large subunit ribosomal protein L10
VNRQEKEKAVALLRENMSHTQGVFLVGYRGLPVPKMEALRTDLRKQGGFLKVVKARLMKKAVEGDKVYGPLAEHFKDQVGLVFAPTAASAVAKVLHTFSKENEAFEIIVGSMDHRILSKSAVITVALLPSREVLLAQLCGLLNAPVAAFACVLSAVVKQRQEATGVNE